ncbi:MAG: peptidoglycan-binding domain-containing protein [Nostoc sp. DedVER02]|uniref:peptidoglycan-binding domain-containing protein n=1 Tax=unclassified Nostoc TaxID=2593658 RepID=UPI002AD49E58|nr:MULTISPECIES: peptidoglycan-binding domain-containing protein [unclassified Nostoc]MDZ7985402.1 peptidoglycan-binding domain-containing protein [Nostoc sp. DedVER02]MDZ8116868.1 peptidoglycan-binding domain-containing protein [Nostoc sp. DedVER01b]
MNWKLLALIPVLTLATAVPAYSLSNNKSHNRIAATQVAQNTQQGNTVKKPNAVRKLNAKHKSNHSTALTVGSRGEAVKTAQNALKQQGFYTANVNGVFDNKTRSAVIKFQKSKGLRADGILGHRTLAALK